MVVVLPVWVQQWMQPLSNAGIFLVALVLGGGIPLDVTAQGDGEPFAGTIWTASYGGEIVAFTPGGGFVILAQDRYFARRHGRDQRQGDIAVEADRLEDRVNEVGDAGTLQGDTRSLNPNGGFDDDGRVLDAPDATAEACPAATASPRASAVPLGASTLWRWCAS